MKSTITIEDNKATILLSREEGTIEKEVDVEDLIKLFKSKDTFIETAILPNHTMKYAKKDNYHHFLIVEPEKEITLKYDLDAVYDYLENLESEEGADIEDHFSDYIEETRVDGDFIRYISLPTVKPKTVWMIQLYERQTPEAGYVLTDTSKIYGIKESFVLPTSRLSYYPFPNIYHHGSICWGDDIPKIEKTTQLNGLCDLMFSQFSNFDLNNNTTHAIDFENINSSNPFFLHLKLAMQKDSGVSFEDRLEFLNSHMMHTGNATLLDAFNRRISNQDSEEGDHAPF